ncbi:unnamed protein product [Effrenium voratum]|nr:unnamed protein product [Effrenium voratum]
MGGMGGLGADQLWSTFLEPAIGRAAKLSGVEFTPNPNDMLDLVEDKFNKDLRTRLFRFSQDSLDCSEELLASLVMRGVRGADRLEMKGGHLTPVVVSLEDVGTMGGMAQNLGDRLKGFSAKVGSEAELEDLVQALMDFVKTIR